MAASPSFDSFYRNKIQRKDAELEDEFSNFIEDEIPVRPRDIRKIGTKGPEKSSRKPNPLRELYASWKRDSGFQGAQTPISVPKTSQLSHVYSLQYKNTLYDKALRSIWQLCPPALTRTLSLLRGLLDGFSHDITVLDHIFSEHKQLLRSPAALLAIGEVPMLNFDLDAITGSIPSPASQRWLAQSKLPASVSLAGVELGGLDPMNMPTRPADRRSSSSRVSFSSLPPYLSDPYSPQLSQHPLTELASPRDLELEKARRHLSFDSVSSGPQAAANAAMTAKECSNYSLGILANSVTNSVLPSSDSHSVLPIPPNTVSGCSYIAPGSPLISELAISMSNAHITHRLDYLAADLTSISSLLWPSSACPSAYFPPPSATGKGKTTLEAGATNVDPRHANADFNSYLGLGSAATHAAISAGALSSVSLAPAQLGTGSGHTRPDIAITPQHYNTSQNMAPNTFTSCIACKNASVDVLLVQLQHDAICVKSGEDEASYLWRMKWQGLHHSHSDKTLEDLSTHVETPSEGRSGPSGPDSEANESSEIVDPSSGAVGDSSLPLDTSPASTLPLSPVPTLAQPSRLEPGSGASTPAAGPTPPPAASASNSGSASASMPPTSTNSAPTGPMRRSPSTGPSTSTSNSSRPKSTTFSSLMSGGSGSSQTAASSHAAPTPQFIPVSDMNLLHLRHRFSFLRHVIFSLLKGRTVVIHAEARNRPWVEQIVASLTCFVPGHHLSSDSVAQSLQQLEPNHSGEYLPRPTFLAKVVPWRDARDVIFEAIHTQSLSSSSTKSRLKHTKLVISRFLELHIQKMKSYSSVAKHSDLVELPTPTTAPSASKMSSLPSHASTAAPSASNPTPSSSASASASSTPVPNIPTLSMASRQALKLGHLAHVKLMGLDKSCPVPKSVERHITYWDWEAEELTCVPYEKGKLLDAMINPKKQWPDEASYRSHIHFHLSDLATRSWMYYHMACIGLVVSGITPLSFYPTPLGAGGPPVASSSPSLPSSVFSIPSASGSANTPGMGYSPPVDNARSGSNPFSVSGSPASSDWSLGRTPTEPSLLGNAHGAPPKISTRSLTAAPTLSSPRQMGSSPPKASHLNSSKTSPIPALTSDDLGFEPSTGMIKSTAGALGASQSISSSSSHVLGTPSKLKDSVTLALGPSLSTLAESTSALPSPPSTLSSPRSQSQQPAPLWSSGIHGAPPQALGSSQSVSQAGKTTAPGKPSQFHLNKTSSSSSLDPRGPAAGSGMSGSSQAQTAPTPADYAFRSHCDQQRTKTAYFASLKVLENDAEIIEYLAELIKSQQSQDVRGASAAFQSFSSLQLNDLVAISLAHDPDMAPPQAPATIIPGAAGVPMPIKLDFTATKTFKNVLLS